MFRPRGHSLLTDQTHQAHSQGGKSACAVQEPSQLKLGEAGVPIEHVLTNPQVNHVPIEHVLNVCFPATCSVGGNIILRVQ